MILIIRFDSWPQEKMGQIKIIVPIIAIIISIALLTLGERKIMASIQRRVGPNIVGVYGILQPIVDGVKLVLKETIMPTRVNKRYYIIAPLISLYISLILWVVVPFGQYVIIDINYSIIYIFAISTLTIYGILYGGWSSHNKYSFIGGIRSTAQLISYEISIGVLIMTIFIINNSMNLVEIGENQIIGKNIIGLLPIFIMMLITLLAESNRTPFDLLEAESELVAGFLVEYSSIIFAAFYLGEYSIMLFWSKIISIIFWPSNITFMIIMFVFIWIRASLPRLRYDQLIELGWGSILPGSIGGLTYYMSIYWGYFV